MIKPRRKIKRKLLEIDLGGPEGNAFALLAHAKNFSHQLSHTKEDTDKIISNMTSGDYENLINVFDNNFGNYVILYK